MIGGIAVVTFLRDRRPDDAAARVEPLSHPLPQREATTAAVTAPAPAPARPAKEEGLRLIPARSIGSVPAK